MQLCIVALLLEALVFTISLTNFMVMANIKLMNENQQGTDNVTLFYQLTPYWTSNRSQCHIWLNHSLSAWGNLLSEQLKDLIPVIKNHTDLDDRTASLDKIIFKRDNKTDILPNIYKGPNTKSKNMDQWHSN